MQRKKGISLIVLVITIIVMLILAGAIILTLNNSGIIDKASDATEKTNLATVQELATLKWAEAYMAEVREQADLEEYVLAELDKEGIDLDKYEITVTENGVDVATKVQIPDDWKESVTAIVDGVPIPKGFVASEATGENTKAGGLVIYEGTDAVTDENVATARTSRNQYVWVPVAKEDFTTKFVRNNFGLSYTISNSTTETGSYAEVQVDDNNMPVADQDVTTITQDTLDEAIDMYASVKKYGGFYVGRYEMGTETKRANMSEALANMSVRMHKIPCTFVTANAATSAARGVYTEDNTSYGVVSTLMYGVQWDSILQWWLDTQAVSGVTTAWTTGNAITNSISNSAISSGARYATSSETTASSTFGDFNDVTTDVSKASGSAWLLTTGALETAKVKNIYDMFGNVQEVTMEKIIQSYGTCSIHRGTSAVGNYSGVAARYYGAYPATFAYESDGFRISLYIK